MRYVGSLLGDLEDGWVDMRVCVECIEMEVVGLEAWVSRPVKRPSTYQTRKQRHGS